MATLKRRSEGQVLLSRHARAALDCGLNGAQAGGMLNELKPGADRVGGCSTPSDVKRDCLVSRPPIPALPQRREHRRVPDRHDSAKQIRVATDELRHGLHRDVGAQPSGRGFKGVAKVLSTPRIAPGFRTAAQIVSNSATTSSEFDGDSNQIRSDSAHACIQGAVSATAIRHTFPRPRLCSAVAGPATP
jgi:hypothetical protein